VTPPVTRIRPPGGWRPLALGELWRYRELLVLLAARDVRVRYKQTALGVAWAVIQPLFTMVVFTVFFGRLGGMEERTGGVPYPLFVLAGLLPWQLFSYALTQASNSLVAEQRLITKVYFPRLVVPLAAVLSGVADFLVAFALVLLGVGGYALAGHPPAVGWGLLAVPGLVLFAVLAALAVGLWLAALNVQYRDVRYTVPFLTQIWLFVTPIAYPSGLVPPHLRWAYGLNPMAGVVDGFRWALVGGPAPDAGLMLASGAVVAVLLAGGLLYFRRLESTFADVV
jgi:lipopolysaccharide transport system permease protein